MMGIKLWGDACTEHRAGSPALHLHSLQRSTFEFQLPAPIFADFPGKGTFALDQEMSLLSHVELKAAAKHEEKIVLGKLRPAANCCGGGTLPSLYRCLN